jgi:hypothetical protein
MLVSVNASVFAIDQVGNNTKGQPVFVVGYEVTGEAYGFNTTPLTKAVILKQFELCESEFNGFAYFEHIPYECDIRYCG